MKPFAALFSRALFSRALFSSALFSKALRHAALYSLALALPLQAAPQWPTLEPYLPDQSGVLLVVNIDKDARETLASALPLDPAIIHRVVDEHCAAFAAASGIQIADITNVFGGIGGTGSSPGVLGIQVPLDLPRIVKSLKSTSGATLLEYPDSVLLTKGNGCWAFLKEGFVLIGKTDAVQAILKRKGGSPTNTAFVAAARAKSLGATNLFLTAALPPGLLPALPDHPAINKLVLDRQITTHLTGITVLSADAGLTLALEFDDAAWATKLVAAVAAGFRTWQDKITADVAAAEAKSLNFGILGAFHPDLVSGRMTQESAAYLAKTIVVKPDGKVAQVIIPRELLKAFRGGGTIMSLGIAAAAAAPALKAAQQRAFSGH